MLLIIGCAGCAPARQDQRHTGIASLPGCATESLRAPDTSDLPPNKPTVVSTAR
eukprot:COSAG03_NODE_20084_length_325_cov_0.446903_1_plen_53_part_10